MGVVNLEEVKSFFLLSKTWINERDLFRLIQADIDLAIEAFIHFTNEDGWRTCHYFIVNGNLEGFKLLLDLADENDLISILLECKTNDNKTLMHHIVCYYTYFSFILC